MKEIFYRICTAFIWNKQSRKKFRNKYIIKKNKPTNTQLNEKMDQLYDKMDQLYDKIIFGVQRSLATSLLHQKTFLEYRNCNQKNTVVLIGAGPTLNNFTPIKNAIYVGLNRAFLYDKVNFTYLFSIDKAGLDTGKEQYYEAFFTYDAVKFIGDQNLGEKYQIPRSWYAGAINVREYMTTAGYMPDKLAYDLSTQPLANSASVSIQAMQFILYTNPKKIYLVGIDCTTGSKKHFTGSCIDVSSRNENADNNDRYVIDCWKQIKEFADVYYPKTEIISVNPVRLKGVFKDVYTREYLKEHLEINPDEIEIMEE